jgi:hypothetical protein
MKNPKMMPGQQVRDGDTIGHIVSRLTTRDLEGNPHQEIEVEQADGRTSVYANDEIDNLEAL